MSDYVFSNNDGMVQNNVAGGTVFMSPGEVWWADDPFVLARPELFSQSPPIVHSTQGREQPPTTPLGETAPTKQRSEPYYTKAKRA